MGKLSRIRSSRLKPLSPKQKRELDSLLVNFVVRKKLDALMVKFGMKNGETARIDQ
jgi:hypothetical protein